MGAIHFSLDKNLVSALMSTLPLKVFVETGTFEGQAIENLHSFFEELHSIELSHEYHKAAIEKFNRVTNVHLHQGDSPCILEELTNNLSEIGILYFLDAHWCLAVNVEGKTSQCPLLDELAAINKLNQDSAIVIDDARLFLSPPPSPHEISHWPNLQQVISSLFLLSNDHELMVINDVIVYYPKIAKEAMENYAHNYGVDWFKAFQGAGWEFAAEEKESVIQKLLYDISLKDTCIKEQNRAIKAYRFAYGSVPLLGLVARVMRRIHEIIKPRLGNLNQYVPRPMVLEKNSAKDSMSHFPLISIVTPSYGQGNFVERTILSVLNQGYPKLEYYIQDGGSSDGTIDVLRRHEMRLSGWNSCRDGGQSHALNIAFAKTTGEIMGWLNSDDLMLPGALHLVAQYFDEHPDVDVVYGNRLLIDENDMEIGRWILPGHDSKVLSWADYIPQETLFWRRQIWNRVDSHIDESFRFAMDWDLLIRFRDAGAKFGHISNFLGAFRIHDAQKTSVIINDAGMEEMNRIRIRTTLKKPSNEEVRRAIYPYLFKHLIVDMCYRIKTRIYDFINSVKNYLPRKN
ncbi:glycosyltransferase [Polynucleobacter sp. MWH-Berg-3C6]|uniref:glycosyltransferase n=1 Tax=Polynucleobacter sp. MWH-Berg-3C6 TaxID=1855882 RepID=UPI002107B7C8|nr:glycosyltransferase [Polynucleobacter sp. MWH-Berg-3C6]MBU3549911.1 glycosyltransferase [Polynucleobacter sp. MWH-Berg-3C6]